MTETDSTETPIRYASFTNRMLASVIDIGLVLMVAYPLIETVLFTFLPPVDVGKIIEVISPLASKHQQGSFLPTLLAIIHDPALQAVVHQQRLVEHMIISNLLQVFFIGLYTLPLWFRYSATPGKMLFRLEIRDAKTGAPMSELQSIVRFLGYFVSLLPLTLGFAWISFNQKHRGFHDYIAGTVVVIKPRKKPEAQLSSSI